ncbi:MAG: nitroreductase [Oscillospiraceae bacterium]|nr:nitroreductase [Oscillospiraceae bacterium]
MDILEAMRARHSVRKYATQPIPADVREKLQQEIDACNREGQLHIQLLCDEPGAFSGAMARYGSFSGVANYIAVAGVKAEDLDERAGYYGERIVLLAQQLGLNTCWVALTFSRRKARYTLEKGEKLVLVIALGYGITQGVPHRSKTMEELCRCADPMPDWFRRGMECAMLAPTAVNQQKFLLTLEGERTVRAQAVRGPYAKLDLGIVKYHFTQGAGSENFDWAQSDIPADEE